MALLVGIDEAGYGPHLGPLVVSAAVIAFDASKTPDPNLWGPMRHWVRRRPSGSSHRAVVCDSKEALKSGDRARGVGILERTVLGFLAASGARPATLAEFLATTAPAAPTAREDSAPAASKPPPWHRPEAVALPHRAEPAEVSDAARKLSDALAAVGGRAARLWVNPAPAARLNHLMDGAGRNKAQALFALTAEILAAIRRTQSGGLVRVVMDQHGGRHYYGALLAGAFPMERIEAIEESAGLSRYAVGAPAAGASGPAMELEVRTECERTSLPTALASMAAKYVRELAMHELNGWFRTLVPHLRPTSGYGRDAWRFLTETEAAREAARVPLETVLRAR